MPSWYTPTGQWTSAELKTCVGGWDPRKAAGPHLWETPCENGGYPHLRSTAVAVAMVVHGQEAVRGWGGGDVWHLVMMGRSETWCEVMVEHPGWSVEAGGWLCPAGTGSIEQKEERRPCGSTHQKLSFWFWYYSKWDNKYRTEIQWQDWKLFITSLKTGGFWHPALIAGQEQQLLREG